MDRTAACGAAGLGSIPGEGTNVKKRAQSVLFFECRKAIFYRLVPNKMSWYSDYTAGPRVPDHRQGVQKGVSNGYDPALRRRHC